MSDITGIQTKNSSVEVIISSVFNPYQPLLSSIVNNKFEGKIGKRKCEEFGKWYNEYRKAHPSE